MYLENAREDRQRAGGEKRTHSGTERSKKVEKKEEKKEKA